MAQPLYFTRYPRHSTRLMQKNGYRHLETVHRFKGLQIETCPFVNLPETKKGRWGEGLTAADMEKCVWLKPELVAAIDYAELTPANHLRHSKFVALREGKKAREVTLERPL